MLLCDLHCISTGLPHSLRTGCALPTRTLFTRSLPTRTLFTRSLPTRTLFTCSLPTRTLYTRSLPTCTPFTRTLFTRTHVPSQHAHLLPHAHALFTCSPQQYYDPAPLPFLTASWGVARQVNCILVIDPLRTFTIHNSTQTSTNTRVEFLRGQVYLQTYNITLFLHRYKFICNF
jgi:hypothetical protein